MVMKRPSLLILALLAACLLLAGCKSTLLARNTTVKDVVPIFKDYLGTHGYTLTYENEATGSYRVSLGTVYVPERSETTKTKMVTLPAPAADPNLPVTAYEDTTWRTVSVPGHYVEATAIISITQLDDDVIITIDTNSAGGSSMDDIKEYFQWNGITIDVK